MAVGRARVVAAALAAVAMAAGLVTAAQAPAAAVPVNPVLIHDTRQDPAMPTVAAPYRLVNVAAGAVVSVTVVGAQESGVVEIYDCANPGALPPMLVSYAVGVDASNLVRLSGPTEGGKDFCFAPTGPAHLLLHLWTLPGVSFSGLGPTSVFDGTVTVGTDRTAIAVPGLAGDATGASLLLTLPDGGAVTAYGCGTPVPGVRSLVGGVGAQSAALVELTGARTLCLRAEGTAGAAVKVKASLTGQFTPTGTGAEAFPYVVFKGDGPLAAPGLEAVTPSRLFDTRTSGTGARRGAGTVYELDLSAQAPAGTTAVVMNVTATDATADGFVTVYPCDVARPLASNLNYTKGQTVPNQVQVALSASRKLCFYTHTPVHLLSDLGGWFLLDGGNGYRPLTPKRLFDTRTAGKPVAAGTSYTYDLSADVDADTEAVTMNVTVTDPAAAGYLTVYPCDAPQPLASNLNFTKGQTVPNLVTVKVSASRTVCFFAQQQLHLLADLAGSFEPLLDTGFYGVEPQRLVDTRNDADGALPAGETLALTVPLPLLDGAVFNVTVTGPAGSGFVTVYPCDVARPVVSNLNYVAGQTVPNLVAVQLSAKGEVCFFTQTRTHLVVDLAGVYSPDPFVDAVPAITVETVAQGADPLA